MFKVKLAFYAVIALLVICIGIPAVKNIGDGFQKDYSSMMDPNKIMNMQIDPNASGMETFVRMTPNGSKAIVKEVDAFGSFLDGVMTFILVALIFAGVIAYLHFRNKAKEEAKFRSQYGSRYGSSSRYGSRW
jgi:large-conductance mechanosensitive channel